MRAFIAVNLTNDLRAALEQAQQRLRAGGADVKWVAPQSIHITLKFLGEVADERVAEVAQAAAGALAGVGPFGLRLEGSGSFPSATAPRVVWVGVAAGAEALGDLARRLEAALEPLGFAREQRPFSPHVTLGRCRSPQGREALVRLLRDEQQRLFGEMTVTRVELMRSDLRPSGAVYTSQREFGLGGAAE